MQEITYFALNRHKFIVNLLCMWKIFIILAMLAAVLS